MSSPIESRNVAAPLPPYACETELTDLNESKARQIGDEQARAAEISARLAQLLASVPAETNAPNAGTATAPPLPDVEGPIAPRRDALRIWDAVTSMPGKPLAFPFAIDTLSELQSNTFGHNSVMQRVAQNLEHLLQRISVKAQLAQIAGERKSSGITLVGSCLAAVAVCGMGAAGSVMTASANYGYWGRLFGAAIQASGQAAGQVVNNTTSFMDKNFRWGGQRAADEARSLKAETDVMTTAHKVMSDQLTNIVEASRQNIAKIWELQRGVDRQKSEVGTAIAQNY